MPKPSELSGSELHGDNFSPAEIQEWFSDEEEAYARMYAVSPHYEYKYDRLNTLHGFRHLPSNPLGPALALGAAFGHELLPIQHLLTHVTIVESSDHYRNNPALDVPTRWIKADVYGKLPFADAHFDMATCFGVLHHIPNVSFVMGELARTLKPGGIALIREPIISMGNWEHPRPGLTTRERGIPLAYFDELATALDMEVLRRRLCLYAPLGALSKRTGRDLQFGRLGSRVDAALSSGFQWNYKYHAKTKLQKVRPTSAFWILRKK